MATDGRTDGTGRIGARDALSYASSGDFLVLFGVVGGGWLLASLGSWLFAAPGHVVPRGFQLFVGVPLALAGAAVLFVGLVAIARKLLADASRRPHARAFEERQ